MVQVNPTAVALSAYTMLCGSAGTAAGGAAAANTAVEPSTSGQQGHVRRAAVVTGTPLTATVIPTASTTGAGTGVNPAAPRGRMRWPETCNACGRGVPQAEDASLCLVPGCRHMRCVQCWKLEDDLVCEEHRGRIMTVRTVRGNTTVVAAVEPTPLPLPKGTSPALRSLTEAGSIMLATIPDTSAEGMNRAVRNFRNFLRFYDMDWELVNEGVIVGYIVARCAPPIDSEIPAWMVRPVEVTTVGTELSALRRWARLTGDSRFLGHLSDDAIFRLIRHLSGSARRTKTTKKPILVAQLQELLAMGLGKAPHGRLADTAERFWRDVTLLVVGLLAGLRRREISGLDLADVAWDPTLKELKVSVRRDKTNQSIINAQCPRVVVVSHALLDVCWPQFAALRGTKEGPLFMVVGTDRGVAPATVATIVRERLPGMGVSPHSLRVGCATELFAAGVPVQTIMEIGRWSSLTALMYVLPSADAMTAATRSMGLGVKVDRVLLQRALGTQVVPPRARRLG